MATLNELAISTKHAFFDADKSANIRQEHLVKAGQVLIDARAQCEASGENFDEWLERNGFQKQRAYEAISAAEEK